MNTFKNVSMLLLIVFLTMLLGCSTNEKKEPGVYQYKDVYVGDNSSVVNILRLLGHHEHLEKVELFTDKEPYGVKVKYEAFKEPYTYSEVEETIIINASYLFALVQNMDWVVFIVDETEHKFDREQLDQWYGQSLKNIKDEASLSRLIEQKLKKDNSLYELYNPNSKQKNQ